MSMALSPLESANCNNPALNMVEDTNCTIKSSPRKNRYYMELTTQRAIPKGAELTIRYNSVFEVYL